MKHYPHQHHPHHSPHQLPPSIDGKRLAVLNGRHSQWCVTFELSNGGNSRTKNYSLYGRYSIDFDSLKCVPFSNIMCLKMALNQFSVILVVQQKLKPWASFSYHWIYWCSCQWMDFNRWSIRDTLVWIGLKTNFVGANFFLNSFVRNIYFLIYFDHWDYIDVNL